MIVGLKSSLLRSPVPVVASVLGLVMIADNVGAAVDRNI